MSEQIALLEAQIVNGTTAQAKVDALNALAREVQRSNVIYAIELATQAYNLSRQSDFENERYPQGMVEALVNLSMLYELQNNLSEALNPVYEALTISDAFDNSPLRLSVLDRLAWAHFRLGNHSKALEVAFELLSLAETLRDIEYQANAYNITGSIYGELGHYDMSIAQFERCLPLFQQLGKKERERAVMGNFSIAYRLSQQYGKALEYGSRVLQLSIEANDLQHQANFLYLVGDVYRETHEDETALEYYRQSLAVSNIHGFTRNTNRIYLGMGRVYAGQQNYVLALEYLQLALTMAQEAGYKTVIYEAHQELASVHEKRGAFQQALHHYRQFHQIRETALSQEQTTKMQYLKLSFDMEQTRREADNQQRRHQEEVRYYEQLSKMKDELIGTASHDLKSPLSSILLGIDMLREHGRLDDTIGQTLLQRLDLSAERMRELISDLLDLAKLETGQGLHIEQIALKAVIEAAVETFQPLAQKQNIQLYLHPHFYDVDIRGDLSRLRRVIDNLLSNAIKYTPRGGQVMVYGELVDSEIVVKIKDTGIGIPMHDIPHLFDRFYRVDDQAHQAVEGTGLGLAIVKSIVEQHGGKIWVESQPGIGSIFSFSMPCIDSFAAV